MPAERSGSVGWVDLNKVGTPGFAEEYYRKNFGVNVGAYRSAPVRAPAPAFTSVPASSVSPVDEIRRRRDVALWNAQRADPEARQGYRDAADECLREEADTLWNNPFPAAGGIWSHNAVIAHRTGKEVDFEDWQVEREQSVKIEEQTEVIARKLEAAGVSAYSGSDTVMVGLVTGTELPVGKYRPIRMLPLIAQRERRNMRNALEYYLKTTRYGHYARYAVFTAPQPVPAFGPLKKVTAALARRISKWASEVCSKYDIEVLFRGMEATRKIRDVDVLHSYHRHANVLYCPTRRLSKKEWAAFLRETHEYFDGLWKDCGRLVSVDEVLKYAFKPDEIMFASPEELKWLYEETFKTRTAETLGSLRVFRNKAEEERVKFLRDPEGSGAIVKVTKATRTRRTEERPVEFEYEDKEPTAHLLTTTCPVPLATPWLEPFVVIQNRKAGLLREAAHDLEVMQIAARRVWDENGAPAPDVALAKASALIAGAALVSLDKKRRKRNFTVHTRSVTVPSDDGGRRAERGEAPPGRAGRWGEATSPPLRDAG